MQTILLLIDLARREYLTSQKRLAQVQQQLNLALGHQSMLKDYQLQQFAAGHSKTNQAQIAESLVVNRRFADRLLVAIEQSATQIQVLEQALEQTQGQVHLAAAKLRSIERLMAYRLAKKEQVMSRLEQKQTDERASLMSYRRGPRPLER